jgi:hypothetical protein
MRPGPSKGKLHRGEPVACNDVEDPIWEAVIPNQDPFAISIKPIGTDPRFAADVQVFHDDGTVETFTRAEMVPGPKQSRTLTAPGRTHIVMANVMIDRTSSADTRLEVASTIGTRTHCHTVIARGEIVTMMHTIRMKP